MAIAGCPTDDRPLPEERVPALKSSQALPVFVGQSTSQQVAGVTSRRNAERVVASAVARAQGYVLAVLDVDQFRLFKNLNGTAAADALLRALCRRLNAAILAMSGNVVRLGADEFALVVPIAGMKRDVFDWTRGILEEASVPFTHRGAELGFSATLGFALLPDQGRTFEAALHCARLAVVKGKQAGGGVCVPCSAVLVEQARARDELARDLRNAITGGQIVPFYQPVMALGTGELVGLEVLARWHHPAHGILLPDMFIPHAEEQGLCRDITRVLFQQTRRHARAWPRHWRFAFNTTPGDLVDVISLIEKPENPTEERIDPSRIELEVTESAVMRDLIARPDLLDSLHPHGVKLVLDDFGTGYANFQQLRQIPFARLKIDKSFIVDMLDDPRAAACVHAIIQLAHHLGMTATAEGVEFAALAERLVAMECDYAQGYHYARPLAASELPRFIDQFASRRGSPSGGLDHAA